MPVANVRFYADLNHFLLPQQRQQHCPQFFEGRVAIKDMIEALGVPHTEVEYLLVNGQPVGFDYLVNDGDIISVYPPFFALDIDPLTHVRPALPNEIRFVLDVHLGRLVAHLRMLGFDTLFPDNIDDGYLAELAARENRVMLTRDRGLLKRRVVTYGYYVRATQPRAQVIEVLRSLKLVDRVKPFTRCGRCNGLLEDVPKETIMDRLQPDTSRYYHEFRRCQSCQQIYWQGSHYERMQQFVAEVLAEARRQNNQDAKD